MSTNEPARDTRPGPGSSPVNAAGVVVVSAVMALIAVLALYALWSFWPGPVPAGTGAAASAVPQPATFTYFRWEVTLSREQQYFLIVAVAGVVGAMLHGLRSLVKYVGERAFVRSWVPSYLMLPFVGAVIATIVYLVLRAGLLPGASNASQPDPFGISAIGALVGWFSAQAAEKMKDVFETLFKAPDPGSDSITNRPTITAFVPAEGPPGTTVAITGTNLNSVRRVVFTADAEAMIVSQSDVALSVEVPGDAQDGPITLDPGPGQVTSTDSFVVTAPDEPDEPDVGLDSAEPEPSQPAPQPMPPPLGSSDPALAGAEGTGSVGTTEELAAAGMPGSSGRVGTTEELAAVGSAAIPGEP